MEGSGLRGRWATELRAAFAGRSAFVTGHTGFKGSWLSLWLNRLGARVTGYALAPPTVPSLFSAARLDEVLASDVRADVRSAATLVDALAAARPDFVFHLAAQALVRASYAEPRETFEVNTLGAANVLEAVRACGRPCVVVVVASDKCYENTGRPEGCCETDTLGGHDPYSASKAAAELIVAAYRRSFFPPERIAEHGIRLASVRAGNVIGGGDWATDRIVADMVRALGVGRVVAVRNPAAIRPWQHVLEPLGGYLQLAARMAGAPDAEQVRWCGAWNFGPLAEAHVTVRELVERFISAWRRESVAEVARYWADVHDPRQPHETATLRLCIHKAQAELNWHPRWDVAEAVRRTADWYRRYCAVAAPRPGDIRAACVEDIAAYEAPTVHAPAAR